MGGRFAEIRWVDETGSTNDDLMLLARDGAAEQVLVADRQTAGRGRLGRRWEAGAGGSLLCSFLVRPALPVSRAHLVPWAVALAALDGCSEVAGVSLRLKWPNDLVAVGSAADGGDAKVAGILSELVVVGDRLDAVVVGIGVNLNRDRSFPPELADVSASLDVLSGGPVDRSALLDALVRSLRRWVEVAEAPSGAAALCEEVVRRSATLGRDVRVELAGGHLLGRAVELSSAGELVVETADGARHPVSVGDVVHLRAGGH